MPSTRAVTFAFMGFSCSEDPMQKG